MSKINIKKTPERIALIQAMASKDPIVREEAKQAFAAFVTEAVKKYLDLAPTVANLYGTIEIPEGQPSSIPLDLFHDTTEQDYYRVVMQSQAGGLATNFDVQTDEVFIQTYPLVSAVSTYNKYIRMGRLDVVSKMMNHMANEILVKREVTSVSPILKVLATETTNGLKHVFRTSTASVISLDDFVNLFTRASRLLSANVGGTPVNGSNSVTDMVISPERLGDIRKMAYEPMNTKNTNVAGIAAPDSFREQVFTTAGIPSFYNVNFMIAHELGEGQKYCSLFKVYASTTAYTQYDGTSGSAQFTTATDDLAIGINANMDALVKPVMLNGDTGIGLSVQPDDQFLARSKKQGWFAEIEEGACIKDTRALVGLII
jgi:hypothetical protein